MDSANAVPPQTEPSLFLAVDLDGTFLGGPPEGREALYGLIESRRNEIALAFVTGRDIPFAAGLGDSGKTPKPDLIIGDVGTSVVIGPSWEPLDHIETWIDSIWQGPDRAAAIAERYPSLRQQDVMGGRRLSFFYSDPEDAEKAAHEIIAHGYDVLRSGGVYFDVLPKGISKGETLLRVLEHLSMPRDRVLVAGDTLNDLSLFETGLHGVAVANAEEPLVARLGGLPNVYRSKGEGAQGILEAIAHFGLLDLNPMARETA